MAETTQTWLKANVGEPSGSWGSTYSAIYKITGEYQVSSGKSKIEKMDALLKLIGEFSYSAHKSSTTAEKHAVKARQQSFLNSFSEELKIQRLTLNPGALVALRAQIKKNKDNYPRELSLVIQVLEDMKSSSNSLIRNTGKGIEQDKIVMVLSDTVSGTFRSDGVMQINPLRTLNKTLLMGLLVHEYHHKLCVHNGEYAYADEFVAHWKEYLITKPAATEEARAIEINSQLRKLYPSQVQRWLTMGNEWFVAIGEAGDFLVADNAIAKKMSMSRHSAAKLPVRDRAVARTQRQA